MDALARGGGGGKAHMRPTCVRRGQGWAAGREVGGVGEAVPARACPSRWLGWVRWSGSISDFGSLTTESVCSLRARLASRSLCSLSLSSLNSDESPVSGVCSVLLVLESTTDYTDADDL